MPKKRPSGSIYDALNRAIGLLTYRVACEVTGLSENHLRKCGDPASNREITLCAAIKIDQALAAQGDEPVLLFAERDGVEHGRTTTIDCLHRAQCELEQAARLLEGGDRDPMIGRLLAELSHTTATLLLLHCDSNQPPTRGATREV